MVGGIPEVLTLVLTPKLTYNRCHICHKCMYNALTYTICMYVNIGVKRSIVLHQRYKNP